MQNLLSHRPEANNTQPAPPQQQMPPLQNAAEKQPGSTHKNALIIQASTAA